MMTRITFVACEINCSINQDRKIKVDLYYTLIVSFIPVIATPRFIVHIFKHKRFIGRQLVTSSGSLARFFYSRFENGVYFIFWNDELPGELLHSFRDRAFAG